MTKMRMVWLEKVRALSGLAAVFTLLGLTVGEFLNAGTLTPDRAQALVGLIAALLGLDMAADYLPVTVEAGFVTVTVGRADDEDENT